MILQRLKAFIEEHPGCTLRQLASHFRLSEDAAAAMLQPWIDRGRLSLRQQPGCSGGCHCSAAEPDTRLYWSAPDQIGLRQ